MSHFNTAVFTRYPGEMEGLLAPFDENVDSDSPYAEFIEDEDGDLDAKAGKKGYWVNPNARFDCWTIGGRWRGMLKLKPERIGKGKYGTDSPFNKAEPGDPERCDEARVNYCDFSPDEDARQKATRFWEVCVEGQPLHDDERQDDFVSFYKPEYFIQRYGSKETYVDWATSFLTYAFVTADGEFVSTGRMGWWGMDDATRESIEAYRKQFAAYLAKAQEESMFIDIVDMHI
jgi:hypothetical protein